jgi:hypothetical protein
MRGLKISFAWMVVAGTLVLNSTVRAATDYQVKVFPSMAHPGDVVYVSGSGFPARGSLQLSTNCSDKSEFFGNDTVLAADSRGQFAGTSLRVPSRVLRADVVCKVDVISGAGHVGLTRIVIRPSAKPLPRCSTRICIAVHALLTRLGSGAQGTIQVTGWPGAATGITVVQSSGHALRRSIRLDWRGTGVVRLRVAPGLLKGTQATVWATARLGRFAGSTTTRFIVVPTGR